VSENASLQRQLESAILDIKRHKEQEREQISLTVRRRFIDIRDVSACLSY